MNYIKAVILEIQSVDSLSIVKFTAGQHELKMMSLELNKDIQVGVDVLLGVKASNIALAKSIQSELSISNQLPCTIESANVGELLCNVKLRFMDSVLESIITKESYMRMELQDGHEVIALIKSSELLIVEAL